MQAYSRIGAFVGFAWVMDTKLCWMLVNAEEFVLTGQRPATGRVQLWCYWRWDRKSCWLFIYFLQGTVLIIHWFLYYQDYGSACEALFDGFKLDPENADIEHALRYHFFFELYSMRVSSHPIVLCWKLSYNMDVLSSSKVVYITFYWLATPLYCESFRIWNTQCLIPLVATYLLDLLYVVSIKPSNCCLNILNGHTVRCHTSVPDDAQVAILMLSCEIDFSYTCSEAMESLKVSQGKKAK